MTARRIGVLGGTFDPFHCGHLDLGGAAESALTLSDVVVITANIPPHRPQPVASSYHRFAMVALAIVGRPRWRTSDLELRSVEPSFTSGTLRRFRDEGCVATDLYFILGADAFAEIETWKDFPSILDLAHFAVVSRPGHSVTRLPTELPRLRDRMMPPSEAGARATPSIYLIDVATADVSATAIRRRAAEGLSLEGLVPPTVRQHIEKHRLYAAPQGAADHQPNGEAHRAPAAGRLHGQD
jgi:nicotinate-nucleotide adenylyltransferase